jgi:hypothetical protein
MAADMNHQHIRENNVVSLYLIGKLLEEERTRFEEHFVDCQQCLDEMELTSDFRRRLRQVTKEDGLSKDNDWVSARRRAAWLKAPARWQPRLFAFASLLLAVSLTAVFFAGARYHGSELAESKRLLDDSERRYAAERQTRENLEKQLQASANNAGDQKKSGTQPQPWMASLEPAPLFFLSVTRGAGQEGNSAPENRIAVPTTSPWIVLSLEFEPDPDFESYRARLTNAQSQILWSAEKISRPPSDAIAVSLPSSLLRKGDYALTLEGRTSSGHYLPAAHFSFRATAQKSQKNQK